ncbi:MAG: DegT/DnrJ/EryC1/StrS family aminotransferase [Candidatus Omnitrophica bacterium]|nr:DegT/DnrJ/EryC1/StrS family aminotransferase [Candidatus Omnitrophota bacterium]
MNKTKLALMGGVPAVSIPAPGWPISGELEVAWMEGVVRSGQWSWLGPHERAFCSEFAQFIGCRYALLLCNGTVTLQCALQAVGVKPGEEVIVPALTWVATLQAALDIGARAVVVDIDRETYCLDPKAAEKAITSRTKAIIPVHLYGCMADMDAITSLAKKYSLKIVEDVAHQHGSRWKNKGAGSLGDAGSFSFQQSKVLTCGEGGAITCNEEEVYQKAFCLKHVGWKPDLATPGNHYGHNYRMTEMQAVLLRGGLRRLPEHLKIREENAARLAEGMKKLNGPVRTARRDERVTRQSYYALTLHYDQKKALGLLRNQYLAALAAEGFPLGTPYLPVYRHPLLNLYDETSPVPYREKEGIQKYRELLLPVTEQVVEKEGLVLMHQHLLGPKEYLDQLLLAMAKVNDNLTRVKNYFQKIKGEEK